MVHMLMQILQHLARKFEHHFQQLLGKTIQNYGNIFSEQDSCSKNDLLKACKAQQRYFVMLNVSPGA